MLTDAAEIKRPDDDCRPDALKKIIYKSKMLSMLYSLGFMVGNSITSRIE